jgi:hypothetical protein
MKQNLFGLFLLTTAVSCTEVDDEVLSTTSSPSLIVNEVYLSRGNMLHALDGTTGTGFRISRPLTNLNPNTTWPDTDAMTALAVRSGGRRTRSATP